MKYIWQRFVGGSANIGRRRCAPTLIAARENETLLEDVIPCEDAMTVVVHKAGSVNQLTERTLSDILTASSPAVPRCC